MNIKFLFIVLLVLFCVTVIVIFVINLDSRQGQDDIFQNEINVEFQEFKNNAKEYNISLVDDSLVNSTLLTFLLNKGSFIIKQENKIIWETPLDWWVDDFEIADVTNDGEKNVVLSVWKSGDYGPSKPFWVTKNDLSIKNHLFVYSLRNNKIKPVWQSSNLEKPNCEFMFTDINNDDQEELLVIEGEYDIANECKGNYLAIWKWNDWGFFNEWRSEEGDYHDIELLLPLFKK